MADAAVAEHDVLDLVAEPTASGAGAVAVRASAPAPAAPKSDAQSLMEVISRAASDPSVDMDKLERLMVMRKEIMAHDAETRFNEAMTAAQKGMRAVSADANNPQTKSKYATYAKLDAALRPIYTSHGFALSFDEGDSPKPEHIRVLCYVSHDAGHTRTYRKDMPADGKGAKGGDVMTKTHASGAAMSYGMRYLLKGVFNVAVGEDDRDGNAAAEAGGAITDEQVAEVKSLIEASGADIRLLCAHWKVDGLAQLRVSALPEVKRLLAEKKRRRDRDAKVQERGQ